MPEGGYLQDAEGKMVITKLNEQLGMEIATASGGIYVRASDVSQSVRALEEALNKLDQAELEMKVYTAYNELYYIPLLLGLLLLWIDFLLLDRKNRYFLSVLQLKVRNDEKNIIVIRFTGLLFPLWLCPERGASVGKEWQ